MQNIWAVHIEQYLRVLGDPVPQDIEHPVGCSPSDHEFFVAIPLVGWKAWKNSKEQIWGHWRHYLFSTTIKVFHGAIEPCRQWWGELDFN